MSQLFLSAALWHKKGPGNDMRAGLNTKVGSQLQGRQVSRDPLLLLQRHVVYEAHRFIRSHSGALEVLYHKELRVNQYCPTTYNIWIREVTTIAYI